MAESNTHNQYSFADIERYISGSMTAKEMHDIECAALQDPFLADAIEGYQDSDKKTTATHLNEIAAAIQGNKSETKIIVLPKRKNYGWQIAASLIIIIGAGVFFLTKQSGEKTSSPLASNDIKKEKKRDSFTKGKDAEMAYQKPDSISPALSNTKVLSKRKNKVREQNYAAVKKEKPVADITASAVPPKEAETTLVSSAPVVPEVLNDKAAGIRTQERTPSMTDTLSSLSEVVVTRSLKRDSKSLANSWTADKGKPFILSEVEVINVGKKKKKTTDTSSVKPEGGWQSFQDYLFSKLSKKGTAAFMNDSRFNGDLELEFSFNEEGSPYNIKVLQAQDSTIANEAISAIQEGPKWISSDKKEKRLNLKY